jgi:hypothetical protein
MQTNLRSSSTVIIKIVEENSNLERTLGFVSSIALNVSQGSKPIFTVDSVFPAEIAAGASPSAVSLQLSCVMLRDSTLESIGIVPRRTVSGSSKDFNPAGTAEDDGSVFVGASKYIHVRLYDRYTGEMFYGVDWCRVNSVAINAQSRSVVRADISLTGMYLIPGNN